MQKSDDFVWTAVNLKWNDHEIACFTENSALQKKKNLHI